MEPNFKIPNEVTEFESKMAKEAVKTISQNDKKPDESAKDKGGRLSMEDQYANAWKIVYNKLPKWRQNELDNQLKSGKLSDKDWDTDFVQQVIALAESDDPQAI